MKHGVFITPEYAALARKTDAARTVYEALRTGTAQPADYLEYLYYPHHAPCVTGNGA